MSAVVLAIDLSGPVLAVQAQKFSDDPKLNQEAFEEVPSRQGVTTISLMAERTLAAIAVQPGAVTHVLVSGGPGSFTGIRLGLAFAMGFAPLGSAVALVPSLEAAALGAVRIRPNSLGAEQLVFVAEEACKESVYVFAGALASDGTLRVLRGTERVADTMLATTVSALESNFKSPWLISSSSRIHALLPRSEIVSSRRGAGTVAAWEQGFVMQSAVTAAERASLSPVYGRSVMAKTISERLGTRP